MRNHRDAAAAHSKAARSLGRPVVNPLVGDREYSAEEVEFLRACDEYRRRFRLRFLTACEFLAVAKSLGYTKP